MNKKILVTGGAGFLGSHLCEKLLEHRHDVICADNLFTGQKIIYETWDHRSLAGEWSKYNP